MNRLYYSYPYKKEAEAVITRIEGRKVFFNDTIFYPEGGGQPGDVGLFNDAEIVDTIKEGNDCAHIFNSTEGLNIGDKGLLRLNWEHRYAFMKRHSAQHLLSSVFYRSFQIGTVAVHLAKEYVTIELDRKDVAPDVLFSVEDIANSLVRKALKIEQRDLPRREAEDLHMRRSIKVDDDMVKVVFIENQDAVACGGVHVSNTSEIGEISFFSTELIRGHLRTIWKVDDAAVSTRRNNLDIVRSAGELLSSPPDGVLSALRMKLEELEDEKRKLRSLYAGLAHAQAMSISSDYSVLFTEYPLEEFRSVLTSDNRRKDIFIIKDVGKKEFLYIGDEGHFTELKKRLSLKGGGRAGIYQGSFQKEGRDLFALAGEVIDEFKGNDLKESKN